MTAGCKPPAAWQRKIREGNAAADLEESGLSLFEAEDLRARDFRLRLVSQHDNNECQRIAAFIKRHEWLGTMPRNIEHRAVAEVHGLIAGAVIFTTPNAFSNLAEAPEQECLIARGACVSWSPKNLASRLISWSMRELVATTQKRVFVAYADSRAGEIGQIYQACNFVFLGDGFGTSVEVQEPFGKRWVSDRHFRSRVFYKRLAKKCGIRWRTYWQKKGTREILLWDNMPDDVVQILKTAGAEIAKSAPRREIPGKLKYAIALGRTKEEDRRLKALIGDGQPYPKRQAITATSCDEQRTTHKISRFPLFDQPTPKFQLELIQ